MHEFNLLYPCTCLPHSVLFTNGSRTGNGGSSILKRGERSRGFEGQPRSPAIRCSRNRAPDAGQFCLSDNKSCLQLRTYVRSFMHVGPNCPTSPGTGRRSPSPPPLESAPGLCTSVYMQYYSTGVVISKGQIPLRYPGRRQVRSWLQTYSELEFGLSSSSL